MIKGTVIFQMANVGSKSEGSHPFLRLEDGKMVKLALRGDNPFMHTMLRPYDLKNVVTGTKVSEDKDGNKVTDIVVIYYFADKDNAEKALEKVKENAKEKKEETKEDWVEPTRSGSMVYFGTKAAIKAAK